MSTAWCFSIDSVVARMLELEDFDFLKASNDGDNREKERKTEFMYAVQRTCDGLQLR